VHLRPALVLAVAVAAASATPARASTIAVSVDGGAYAPLPAAPFDLTEEIDLQAGAGRPQGTVHPTGYSLQRVAELVNVASAQSATVFNPSAASESFSHSDIYGAADAHPVITAFLQSGWQLYWPIRTADEDNYTERPETSTGYPDLYVELSTRGGTIAVPEIQASPARPDAGQIVSFALGRPVNGAQSYAWDFGDGTGASGASPVHAFAAGTYPVKVTVTSTDGSGVSPPFTLVVGSPPPAATGTPSAGGTGSSQSLPTGPVKGGNAPAPAPTPGAKPRGRSRTGGHVRTGHRARPRATATATTAPRAAATPAPAATPGPTATPVHTAGGSPTATPAPPVTRPAPKRATGLVGVLVSALPAAALGRSMTAEEQLAERLAAARKAAASAPDDRSPGAVDSAVGGGAAIALLALGALRERRRLPA
jgi:hypothetical protein